MSYVETAKIPMEFASNIFEIPEVTPMREKSSWPHMRKALQSSSLARVLPGTLSVGHGGFFLYHHFFGVVIQAIYSKRLTFT